MLWFYAYIIEHTNPICPNNMYALSFKPYNHFSIVMSYNEVDRYDSLDSFIVLIIYAHQRHNMMFLYIGSSEILSTSKSS